MTLPHQSHSKSIAKMIAYYLSGTISIGSIILTVAAFFGDAYWWLDLWANFRLQYILALSLATTLYFAWRKWLWIALVLPAILVNSWYFVSEREPKIAGQIITSNSVNLITWNVNKNNDKYSKLLKLLNLLSPDIVVLQEITSEWRQELSKIESQYKYNLVHEHHDWRGIAVLSKLPMRDARFIPTLSGTEVAAIAWQIELGEVPITFVGTKTFPPTSREWSGWRDRQLAALGAYVANRQNPIVVVGDLNATRWSVGFERFLQQSGKSWRLTPHRATWPTLLGPLGIQIDHVLVTPDLNIVDARAGPDLGSDHRPLLVSLTLVESVLTN